MENLAHPGTPDVVCVAGWLELKVAERPSSAETRVDVDVLPSQRAWLKKWRQHGGRAWTLTLLGETWILHDALWASEHLGLVPELELIQKAEAVWTKAPSFEQLARALFKQKQVN